MTNVGQFRKTRGLFRYVATTALGKFRRDGSRRNAVCSSGCACPTDTPSCRQILHKLYSTKSSYSTTGGLFMSHNVPVARRKSLQGLKEMQLISAWCPCKLCMAFSLFLVSQIMILESSPTEPNTCSCRACQHTSSTTALCPLNTIVASKVDLWDRIKFQIQTKRRQRVGIRTGTDFILRSGIDVPHTNCVIIRCADEFPCRRWVP